MIPWWSAWNPEYFKKTGDTFVDFFPHSQILFEALGVLPDQLVAGRTVAIDGAVLRELIATALAAVNIDEDDYCRYDDIHAARENGKIGSLNEHYSQSGYFEGRFAVPSSFDADWYLQTYPDVRLAIESGGVQSAKEHYLEMGWKEWRAPGPASVEDLRRWRRLLK